MTTENTEKHSIPSKTPQEALQIEVDFLRGKQAEHDGTVKLMQEIIKQQKLQIEWHKGIIEKLARNPVPAADPAYPGPYNPPNYAPPNMPPHTGEPPWQPPHTLYCQGNHQ